MESAEQCLAAVPGAEKIDEWEEPTSRGIAPLELKQFAGHFSVIWEAADEPLLDDPLLLSLQTVGVSRARGRPSGSIKHRGQRLVVRGLLDAVSRSGGRLTFDRHYPDNGSLVPALTVIAPLLPTELQLGKMPASRLEVFYAEWKELAVSRSSE
jgi:hypothetical protein